MNWLPEFSHSLLAAVSRKFDQVLGSDCRNRSGVGLVGAGVMALQL
jgi:hypothetical protein